MLVKLLIPRAANGGAQNIGDEVDVSLAEYEAMLAAGHCGEHPDAAAEQAEMEAKAQAEAELLAAEADAEAEARAKAEAENTAATIDAETATVAPNVETATPKKKPERA